jgi:hypothetical protein
MRADTVGLAAIAMREFRKWRHEHSRRARVFPGGSRRDSCALACMREAQVPRGGRGLGRPAGGAGIAPGHPNGRGWPGGQRARGCGAALGGGRGCSVVCGLVWREAEEQFEVVAQVGELRA